VATYIVKTLHQMPILTTPCRISRRDTRNQLFGSPNSEFERQSYDFNTGRAGVGQRGASDDLGQGQLYVQWPPNLV
jgi:hypothetical protein